MAAIRDLEATLRTNRTQLANKLAPLDEIMMSHITPETLEQILGEPGE